MCVLFEGFFFTEHSVNLYKNNVFVSFCLISNMERDRDKGKVKTRKSIGVSNAFKNLVGDGKELIPCEFQQNIKAGQIEREAWVIVEELLEYKLGNYLVKRFFDKPKVKKNHMMIPNVAKASLRFNTSPAATAAICKT